MNLTDVSVIVLASGASNRFGGADKLLAPLRGKPLAQYVADSIVGVEVKNRYLVAPRQSFGLHQLYEKLGFTVVVNPAPELGQGSTIGVGVKAALLENPSGIMVCLADMPFISAKIFSDLASAIGASDAAICETTEGRVSPPALFSKEAAGKLMTLSGDIGARNLIDKLPAVVRLKVDDALLQDIDTPEELLKAQATFQSQTNSLLV